MSVNSHFYSFLLFTLILAINSADFNISFTNSSDIIIHSSSNDLGPNIVDIIDSKMAGNIIAFLSARQFLNGDFDFSADSQNQVFVLTIINLEFMNIYSKSSLEIKKINEVSYSIQLVSSSIIHVSDQIVYIQLSYGKIK